MSTEATIKTVRKVEREYFKELTSVLRNANLRIVDNVRVTGDCYAEFTFLEQITDIDVAGIVAFFGAGLVPYEITGYADELTLSVCLRKGNTEE